jgi:hypothetical protein
MRIGLCLGGLVPCAHKRASRKRCLVLGTGEAKEVAFCAGVLKAVESSVQKGAEWWLVHPGPGSGDCRQD